MFVRPGVIFNRIAVARFARNGCRVGNHCAPDGKKRGMDVVVLEYRQDLVRIWRIRSIVKREGDDAFISRAVREERSEEHIIGTLRPFKGCKNQERADTQSEKCRDASTDQWLGGQSFPVITQRRALATFL